MSAPRFQDLWDEQDVPTTLFEKLLANNKLSTPERAEALTQLARCQGLSNEFDAAHATLDAIPVADRPIGSVVHIRWLLEKGRVLRSSGKAKDPETKACFVAAFNDSTDPAQDYFKVDAAHMLAIIDANGRPEGSPLDENWTSAALKLARGSVNPATQMWAASLVHNAAWDAMDANNPQQALALFTEARTLRKRAFDENPTPKNKRAYRISRWSVARALRECGQNQEAYDIQTELWSEEETKPVEEEIAILKKALGLE
uniref:Uncharacterized protein n=1 Tax=Mycena chlorophos TaxID=658473 RepID=A0ABQ0KZF7_MYCCL|nr:predicted protein [Mycena chlorophos]